MPHARLASGNCRSHLCRKKKTNYLRDITCVIEPSAKLTFQSDTSHRLHMFGVLNHDCARKARSLFLDYSYNPRICPQNVGFHGNHTPPPQKSRKKQTNNTQKHNMLARKGKHEFPDAGLSRPARNRFLERRSASAGWSQTPPRATLMSTDWRGRKGSPSASVCLSLWTYLQNVGDVQSPNLFRLLFRFPGKT